MGQHRHNPTAIDAKAGILKSRTPELVLGPAFPRTVTTPEVRARRVVRRWAHRRHRAIAKDHARRSRAAVAARIHASRAWRHRKWELGV